MPREQAERELRRMVEALRHESFYVTGTWVEESLGVYVGWVARKVPSPTECRCETNGETWCWYFPARSFPSRERSNI